MAHSRGTVDNLNLAWPSPLFLWPTRRCKQDRLGSTYLMQCSVLKPEMLLELVVKCDAPDAAKGVQLVTNALKDALASYLR